MNWIDASEELPMHSRDVLVWADGNFHRGYYSQDAHIWRVVALVRISSSEVTHWTPITKP